MVILLIILLSAAGAVLAWLKPWATPSTDLESPSAPADPGPDVAAAAQPSDDPAEPDPAESHVVEPDPDPVTTVAPDPVMVADPTPSPDEALADDVAAAIGVGDADRAAALLARLDEDHPRYAALHSSVRLLQHKHRARAAGDEQAQVVAEALTAGDLAAAAEALAALDDDHPRHPALHQALADMRAQHKQQAAAEAADTLAAAIVAALDDGDLDAASEQLARLAHDHPQYPDLEQRLRQAQKAQAAIADRVAAVEQALAAGAVAEATEALAAVPDDHPRRAELSAQLDAVRQRQEQANHQADQVAEALAADDVEQAAALLAELPASHPRHENLTAAVATLRQEQEAVDAQAHKIAVAIAADDAEQAASLLAALPVTHPRHAALGEDLTALQARQAAARQAQIRQELTEAIAQRRAQRAQELWQSLDQDPDFADAVPALVRRQAAAWQLVEDRWQAERYQEVEQLLPQLAAFPELAERSQAKQAALEAKITAWGVALEQSQEQYDNGNWRAAAEALAEVPVGEPAIGEGREAWRSLLADRIGRQVQETVQERLQAFVAEVQAGRYAEARTIAEDVRPLAEVAGQGEVVTRLLERLAALEEAGSTPSQETP